MCACTHKRISCDGGCLETQPNFLVCCEWCNTTSAFLGKSAAPFSFFADAGYQCAAHSRRCILFRSAGGDIRNRRGSAFVGAGSTADSATADSLRHCISSRPTADARFPPDSRSSGIGFAQFGKFGERPDTSRATAHFSGWARRYASSVGSKFGFSSCNC